MQNQSLPPLRFVPQYQYRLWGGGKLQSHLGRDCQDNGMGESWEISAVDGFPSTVKDGPWEGKTLPEMIRQFPEALLGKKCIDRYGATFPLLIKFIDARLPLSVQVHPNDDLAKKRHNCNGKNEMWYILDTDPNAELILGFNQNINAEHYAKLLADNRIEDVLHREKVEAGDVVNVPAGLIHAIGGGVLLAEIQQSSDVTYRVYDFNRTDAKTGQKRTLHTEDAIAALDFSAKTTHKIPYTPKANQPVSLIDSPYFHTRLITIQGEYKAQWTKGECFRLLIGVDGNGQCLWEGKEMSIGRGDCLLLPAVLGEMQIKGDARLLEVSL